MTEQTRDRTLFFVCGHPRTGTNWVRNLLNLHPKVYCDGESPFARFREIMDSAREQFWSLAKRPTYFEALERGVADTIRACTLTLLEDRPGAECVGDHTPRLLWPYVPGARLVHVTRDGRDVLVSWTYHQMATGFPVGEPYATQMSAQRAAFANDPFHFKAHPEELLACEPWVRHMARNWSCYMVWDRDTKDRMTRGEIAPAPVHDISYESLHADVEVERRKLYRFLGVDPEEAEPVALASNTAPGRLDEDPTSNMRAARMGEWKTYFTDDTKRWFKESAGEALVEFGYERDSNW